MTNIIELKVEYKTLNEITKWDKRFNNINNNYDKSFKHVSAATLKNLKSNNGTIKLLSTGNFDGFAKKEDAEKYMNNGEIFTIPSGGSANIKYYNGDFVDSGNIIGTSLDTKIYNTKYIYYYLENNNKVVQSYFRGSGVKHPDMSSILNIKIPIPPMEIQCEIVRVLDDFNMLTEELTEELTARKKQYNYYLKKLIDIDNEKYEKISIGELFEFKNGINKGKEFFGRGTPIINYIDVYKNNKLYADTIKGKVESSKSDLERYECRKGDVFFTRTSETKEEVGFASVLLEDIKNNVFSGFLLRARPITNKLIPKYCAYCFLSPKIRSKIVSTSNFTTRATTTGVLLSRIKIPVPPIEVQEKIVNILDKFDKLTNDISEGLPAEIGARKKQYEYYRNKLLKFKELKIT